MLLWNSLRYWDGFPITKRIRLKGLSLTLQADLNLTGSMEVGVVQVGAGGYELWTPFDAACESRRIMDGSIIKAYFLPWQQGQVTEVSFHELDESGCTVFLTSEFSGCRFVLANDRVQHVAYFAGPLNSGTSADRDAAQRNSWGTRPPQRLRTFSISNLPGSAGTGPHVADGYGVSDAFGFRNDNARALVIGRKVRSQWHFYMQKWVEGNDDATTLVRINI